jgi:succinoglycan biosynthesis protein ExoO
MMTPRVSVIMACFNAAPHIGRAIKSVLAQTGVEVELIVVDDCSTDGTVEVVQRLVEADARVTLIQQSRNTGPSAARNVGFRAATSDWLTIIDSDDAYLSDRLDLLVAAAKEGNYDLIFDHLTLYDGVARICTGIAPSASDVGRSKDTNLDLSQLILSERPGRVFRLGFLKPLIRRAFLEANGLVYREDIRLAEDFMFYAEALLRGARCNLINHPGYVYTTQVGQSSGVRSTASHTIYDPRVRLRIAARLIADYADTASPTDQRLLNLYQRWQRRYVAIYHMSLFQRQRQLGSFLTTALTNPRAAAQFVLTSGTFKSLRTRMTR